ncbi:T5orf172 domain-containing protein [Trichoderma velutinum]
MPNVYSKRGGIDLDDGTTATNPLELLTPPRTPSPTPDMVTKNDQPSTENFDSAVLKSRLGLQNGRCGCLTQKKKPCKNPTPEKNRTKVLDSLIESVVALTQSSIELEDKLQNLAELVHCHHHDYGRHIEDRIEKWKSFFPTGDPDAKPVIPLEKQIKLALRRDYTYNYPHCMGKTLKQQDCRGKIRGQRVQNYYKTIDEIIKSVVGHADTKTEYLLEVLAYNGLCDIAQHQLQSRTHIELWTSRLIEIRSTYQAETRQLVDSCTLVGSDVSGTSPQLETVQSPMLKNFTKNDLENQLDSTPVAFASPPPDQYWPEAFDESPFQIIKRKDSPQDRESSFTEVKINAIRPLEEESDDLKNGFIYLYTVEGNERFVKIGYTTRSPETRHKEWKESCNREPKPLFESRVVPNVRRIEALCHAELDYCRTRVYCTGCLIQHTEWFESTPDDAISVIQKWSKWMESHPYIEALPESDVKWELKPEEMQKFDDVDIFMKDFSLRFDK